MLACIRFGVPFVLHERFDPDAIPIFEQIGDDYHFQSSLPRKKCMKLLTILLAPIVAVGMASTALARDYKDLVAEGYRWVSLDGPYACPTKEDLRRITREPSDTN